MATVEWRKSTRSGVSQNTDCVELARFPTADIGVRDSKNPGGGHLVLARDAAHTFLSAIKAGQYDQ